MLRTGDVLIAPWASVADVPTGVRLWRVPFWRLLRGATARLTEPLALKVSVRRALDAVVAACVTSEVTEIVAPSLAAQRTFARLRGAQRVLMVDLPMLRELHEDLDCAARALPRCEYLRHHRASQAVLVQQLEECQLATRVLVRNRFAGRIVKQVGVDAEPMATAGEPEEPLLRAMAGGERVLLAGSTASRHGLEVALVAMACLPQVQLVARFSVGSDTSSLKHPRLTVLQRDEPLPPVSCVWAPSWVESTPNEVVAAARAKIAVVATERALGWVAATSPTVRVISPGDSSALQSHFKQLVLPSTPPHPTSGAMPLGLGLV